MGLKLIVDATKSRAEPISVPDADEDHSCQRESE